MKRRDFLRISAIAGTGAFISTPILGKAFSYNELTSGSSFDVLCIGTGYGSAVTALRLAEAGKRVLMLEMGLDWQNTNYEFSSMAWATKESTWLRNTTVAPFANYRWLPKFTGVLERVDFDNISIWQGKGVGGGSIANGGMAVTPKREYFEEIFPNLNADDFYETYFPRANNELGVTIIPEDYYQTSEYYQFTRVGEKEAENCGYETIRVPNVYDFEYMKQEEEGTAPKSALAGEVIYGNNHGKKDLTKTYLKDALATGNVTILGLHRADQLIDNGDGSYTIFVSQIDTKGRTVNTKNYTTKKLFLGAGSIGTTKLLLHSNAKGTLPNLDTKTVGKYWGNNGNVMCGRKFTGQDYGAKQSTIPVAGVDGWSKSKDAIFAELAPLPIGLNIGSAIYLIINRVPRLGEIYYDYTKNDIHLNWNSYHNQHMVENAEKFIDTMSKVNGGSRTTLLPNGVDEKICYHPLGGCVLGKATDNYGKLNNHDGIFITDGSLIPGSVGVNPFVTITAVAEYCIEHNIQTQFNDNDHSSVFEEKLNFVANPNPFSDYLTLVFEATTETTAYVEMTNWAGSVVGKTSFSTVKGKNNYKWNGLGHLWRETYTIRLQVDNLTESLEVVKT